MKQNVGSVDRIIRILIGLALLGYGLFGGVSTATTVVLSLLGLIALGTGLTRVCLFYNACGITTVKREGHQPQN